MSVDPDVEPDEVSRLRAEGFVPIEELTGEIERATMWPVEHRRVVVDWRYEPGADGADHPGITDGACYLVRSPWPTVGVVETMALLDRWVRRHRPTMPPSRLVRVDIRAEAALTETFLAQDEAWVRAFREGHIGPAER